MTGKERINCAMEGQPPYFFDEYLYEHYIPLADLIHSAGGYLWVHSCGNSCHEQELFDDDGPQYVRDYTRNLFEAMAGNPRFIYSSSCNTSPRTPWPIILALHDAAREYG